MKEVEDTTAVEERSTARTDDWEQTEVTERARLIETTEDRMGMGEANTSVKVSDYMLLDKAVLPPVNIDYGANVKGPVLPYLDPVSARIFTMASEDKKEQTDPFMQRIQLVGKEIVRATAQVDNGAMRNCIAQAKYKAYNICLGPLRPSTMVIGVANNQQIPSLGTWMEVVRIGGVEAESIFEVFKCAGMFKVILGKLFLRAAKAIHKYSTDTIYINTPTGDTTIMNKHVSPRSTTPNLASIAKETGLPSATMKIAKMEPTTPDQKTPKPTIQTPAPTQQRQSINTTTHPIKSTNRWALLEQDTDHVEDKESETEPATEKKSKKEERRWKEKQERWKQVKKLRQDLKTLDNVLLMQATEEADRERGGLYIPDDMLPKPQTKLAPVYRSRAKPLTIPLGSKLRYLITKMAELKQMMEEGECVVAEELGEVTAEVNALGDVTNETSKLD